MKSGTRTHPDSYHRRAFLKTTLALLAPGATPAFCAKGEFWTQRDVAAWSESERDRILKNSPWAHRATVAMGAERDGDGPMGAAGRMGGGGGMDSGGMGGRGGGLGGAPMGGGGGPMSGGGPMGGDPGSGGPPNLDAIVRWEAAPLRALRKISDAPDGDVYLLSVSGLPMMGMGRRPQSPEGMPQREGLPMGDPGNLARTAQLEMKNSPPVRAARAERAGDPPGTLLFYFDRAGFPITAATKEVTFSVRLGPMTLKARFTPKDMMYKSELAL